MNPIALLRKAASSPLLLPYLGTLILFGLVSLYSPGFASPSHIASLLILAAFTGIAALGQSWVIIGGGIDLSVPWLISCGAVLVTALSRGQDGALFWAIPLILCAGAIVGALNGAGIALLRVPPIVMTLSTNVILQGLLLLATRGFPPPMAPKALQFIANGRLGPLPVVVLFWALLLIIAVIVERRTLFGRYLYATGTNRTVAIFSGVPVTRTTIIAYAISGVSATLAGILLAGYSRQAYLGMGNPFLFTTIAAVAIGGASILGGTGSYIGTVAGALLLTDLTGLLPIFRLDSGALAVIYGAVILATVALSSPHVRALFRRD